MARTGRPKKEGTEYTRRGRVWYATYRDADGTLRSRSTGHEDRDGAEIEHGAWMLARSRPVEAAACDAILAVILNHYAEHARHLRSAREAGRAIQRIAAFFGGATVAELTPARQDAFAAHLRAAGCSAGYARRIVAILAAAVHRAHRDGLIKDHPVIRRPPAGESRKRWLTPDEAGRLFEAMTEPDCRRFAMLALHTGARSEAIYELTWQRVDLAGNRIDYRCPEHPETTKRRAVSRITPDLAAELEFTPVGERSGYVIRVASIKRSFRTAARNAGLGSDVTENTLRHTFASWAVQAGVALIKVARALGHSSTQMVEKHYGHLAPDHMGEVAAAVGAEFHTRPALRVVAR